jgi:hypothetical protein
MWWLVKVDSAPVNHTDIEQIMFLLYGFMTPSHLKMEMWLPKRRMNVQYNIKVTEYMSCEQINVLTFTYNGIRAKRMKRHKIG